MTENLTENNILETAEPVTEPEKPKKKIKKRYIFGGIGAVLIVGAVFLAFFNPVVKNQIRKLTMSEKEYYRTVEKENFSNTAEMIGRGYSSLLYSFFGNQNYLLSGNIEITPDFAALPFENGLNADIALNYIRKNNDTNLSLLLNTNGEDLGKLDAELQDENLYFSYPLISDSTLATTPMDLLGNPTFLNNLLSNIIYSDYFTATQSGFDYTSLYNTETNNEFLNFILKLDLENYLTPKELENLSNKYYGIIIDSFSDVSKQTQKNPLDDTTKYTVLTAKMNIYDTKETVIRLLEELKKEKFIYAIIADLPLEGIDEHTVSGILDILIGRVDKGFNDYISSYFEISIGSNTDVVFKTYVASNGAIISREYYLDGDKTTNAIGYAATKKGNDIKFSVNLPSLEIEGYGTLSDGVFSGDIAANDCIIRVDNFSWIKAAGGVYPKMSVKVETSEVFDVETYKIETDFNNGISLNLESYNGLKLNLSQRRGEGLTEEISKENAVNMETWLNSVDTEKFMGLMGQLDKIIPSEDTTANSETSVTDTPVITTTNITDITTTSDTTTATTANTTDTTDVTTSANTSGEITAVTTALTPTPYFSDTLSLTFNIPGGYNGSEESGQLVIENGSEMLSIEESVYKFRNSKEISDLFAATSLGKVTEAIDDSSVGGQTAYRVTFVDSNNRTAYIYYVPSKNITVTVIAGESSPLLAVQTLIIFK